MEGDPGSPAVLPAGSGLGFAALLLLFAASLLTVLAWLLQVTRWFRPAQPGARGLLGALCGFPSIRDSWGRAWAQALNREALRSRSSVQMMFEENISLQPNVHISQVSCTQRSDSSMVYLCRLSADTVRFPVSVTQESPAAVSCDTYQVSLTIQSAKIEVRLQELQQAGLLVSWSFAERPDMLLHVAPKPSHQKSEGGADLCTVQDLVQNALLTAEPAMMFNLKAPDSNLGVCDRLIQGSPSRTDSLKLLVRQLHLRDVVLQDSDVELICEAEMDGQRKKTGCARMHKTGEAWSVSWSEEMILQLTPQSRELSLKVWQMGRDADGEFIFCKPSHRLKLVPVTSRSIHTSFHSPLIDILLGHTKVALKSPERDLCGKRVCPLTMCTMLPEIPAPSISVEFYISEANLLRATLGTPMQRINITPTKKVEMDRAVMPDGTIVTTVTTIQSRPKLDDSPARSPSKVEVTENKPVLFPRSCSAGSSPSGSGGSPSSMKLDPVAETAIRQLTEPSNKSSKRTPTKRSTLIISGVSKVPIGDDEMALSLGYAASMDASLYGISKCFQVPQTEGSADFPSEVTTSHGQDTDETTRSDISDRPSLDDLDSETGSTGALETRSLKDHKVGFLRSGTKLLFRRHHRDAGLSQSHDDLTNAAAASRKKSSFPRRLFKRFSLKTKSKPNVNGSAQAGEK
ncbi:phospholipid transfer protein C2CD2L isoform X2 [Bufo bufo]|uniref:phospholipid transfer protein C2CD2L isoform X2 n=1 Tax=Bufo bufo TaxID=8384 RepID=UPI001ABE5CE2|nr:phospholipid transfer protein C2CD2L isoform X2 [Bufo bufo]